MLRALTRGTTIGRGAARKRWVGEHCQGARRADSRHRTSMHGPALLPLLEAMMLVDSDAWQLFDAANKARFRQSTLAVFADVRRLVGE